MSTFENSEDKDSPEENEFSEDEIHTEKNIDEFDEPVEEKVAEGELLGPIDDDEIVNPSPPSEIGVKEPAKAPPIIKQIEAKKENKETQFEKFLLGKGVEYIKWFALGILIAAIIAGAYVLANNLNKSQPATLTGLAVYDPTEFLDGWKLVDSRSSLAEIYSDMRAQFLAQGVKDAAMWKYQKDDDTLYIWLRVYPDKETLEEYDSDFVTPFSWRTRTNLGLNADRGFIGIYKDPKDRDPLLTYVAKDNIMMYIGYYNQNGAYNATNQFADERFLVSLTRNMLEKLNQSG